MLTSLKRAYKIWKDIRRKEAEVTKAQRRLALMPLDYIAIQQICDNVSAGYNVEITIHTKDGNVIEFRRGTNQQSNPVYQSFAEKYKSFHNGETK